MAIFKGLKKNEKYNIYFWTRYIGRDVRYLHTGQLSGAEIMARDDWKPGLEARLADEPDAAPVAISRRAKLRGIEAIVMSASTTPASTCWGVYKRVAVVIVNWSKVPADRELPAMISDHARGVVRIVATWENCHVGTTDRCAFGRAMKAAQALADRLNKEGMKK